MQEETQIADSHLQPGDMILIKKKEPSTNKLINTEAEYEPEVIGDIYYDKAKDMFKPV